MNAKALTHNTSIINWSDPATKGLVGAWRLNEGAGKVAVNSYSNKSGTLKGTSVYGVGKYGKCVNFDGSSGCVISVGTGLVDISKPLSFTALVKTNTISTFPVIFGCRIAEASPYLLFLHRVDRTGICLQVEPGGGATITAAPSKNLTVGTWTHVGFTWDQVSSTAKLFQDGIMIYSATFTIGAWSGSTTTETYGIGSYNDNGLALNWDGGIKECLLFQRNLTETEFKQLYIKQNNIYL